MSMKQWDAAMGNFGIANVADRYSKYSLGHRTEGRPFRFVS